MKQAIQTTRFQQNQIPTKLTIPCGGFISEKAAPVSEDA